VLLPNYNPENGIGCSIKPANTKRLENQRSDTKLFTRSIMVMKVISGQDRKRP
jgi:hypothetical protein